MSMVLTKRMMACHTSCPNTPNNVQDTDTIFHTTDTGKLHTEIMNTWEPNQQRQILL